MIAAPVPASAPEVLDSATYARPASVVWTGERFAVAYEVGEYPNRVVLRQFAPLSVVPSAELELTSAGSDVHLAVFSDGSMVAVWVAEEGWFGRFVDAAGTTLSEAFPLEVVEGWGLRVSAGSEGRWVVAFDHYDAGNETWRTQALRFQGSVQLDQAPLEAGGLGYDSDVAMLSDGQFLANWIERVELEPEPTEDFPMQTWLWRRAFAASGEPLVAAGYVAPEVHSDEQGLDGHSIIAAGPDEYLVAWIDSVRSDYGAPPELYLHSVGPDGSANSAPRLVAELGENGYGPRLAANSASAVIAIGDRSVVEGAEGDDIVLFDVARDGGTASRLSISDPAIAYEFYGQVAISPGGAGLAVWTRSPNVTPTSQTVVRSFAMPHALLCGDANYDSALTAVDALGSLQSAVGSRYCAEQVCDSNGDGQVTASDASATLKTAVGIEVSMLCPDGE